MLEFFADNLLWFVFGTIIFGFALIGYFVENGFRGKQILKKVVVDKPNVEVDEIEKIKSNLSNSNQSLSQAVQGGNGEVLDLGGNTSNSTGSVENNGGEITSLQREPVIMADEPIIDLNTGSVTTTESVVNPTSGSDMVVQTQVSEDQLYDKPLMEDTSIGNGPGFQG